MLSPESWGSFIATVGFPIALVIVLIVFLWRVLVLVKPYVERAITACIHLLETLAANDSKHVSAQAESSEGHTVTHQKLDDVHKDVCEIRDHLKGD